ncbi:MAG: phosphate ABC transporter substrate-binding protein PstS [Actinomycetota bacterium]
MISFARRWAAVALLALVTATMTAPQVASQESYQRIQGEGSSWAGTAIANMAANVNQFGITVDYTSSGSTTGRRNYIRGITDFAASDIPFQFEPEDGSDPEVPPGQYAYIPVTAGGTSFLYNLKINGQPVTNLRLSGENVALIFTGEITKWNDERLAADNPGLSLPARDVIPVVRSDGSGSSAQFTAWMIDRHPQIWLDYCEKVGRAPACGETSFYPISGSMVGQAGDDGVASYVGQSFGEGAIGYANYSFATNNALPVAKVLNAAGFYTEPTPENVAVSLLQARIVDNPDDLTVHLTQDLSGVYTDTDPRAYQLSSYSYFILPIEEQGQFTAEKGRTLAAFANFAMCEAQQNSASLGYSPIPLNLVTASLLQIEQIPGAEVEEIDLSKCNNPTFSSDGDAERNLLAENAPFPQECDRQANYQCGDGTAGLRAVSTIVNNPEQPPSSSGGDGSGGSAGGGSTGGGSSGGSTGGGSTGGGSTDGGTTDGSGTAGDGGGDGTGTDTGDSSGDGSDDDVVIIVGGSTGGSGGDGGQVPTDVGGAVEDNPQTPVAESDLPVGPIVSTVLPQQGSGLLLTGVVIVLLLAVVVVPAYAWRAFSEESGSP